MAFAQHEVEAARLWRKLDTLSRMWVAGADAGPPRFGPQAIAVLQHPPRLATVDLPPAAARQAVEAIAGEWRASFRELLEEPLSEAEAA